MKKHYFAKLLPVKPLKGQTQQLYICTRKIEVGDTDITAYSKKGDMFLSYVTGLTFEKFYSNGRAQLVKEGYSSSHTYPFEYHNDKLHGIEGDSFKVIGIVSEYAKWVKEGDTFYKSDLDFEVSSDDKSSKYLEIGDKVTIKGDDKQTVYQNDREGIIVDIKFKYADQYGDSVVDWEDEFEIGEVTQGTFNPDADEKDHMTYKRLTNVVETRQNLQFKFTNFTICKIKCSQCETFH